MQARLSPEERILTDAPAAGKLAQAYLIRSASAKGAYSAALAFCRRIMCENKTGCRACTGCARFDGGNHVDVFRVEKDGPLKKEDVEAIPGFISAKAYEGGYKCILIKNADMLNPTSQNLLLKSVEEPPENVVFIFSTANPAGVLKTIRSRCMSILIRPRPLHEIASRINGRVPEHLKSVYAAYSGGSPDEAEALMANEGFLSGREAVMAALETLAGPANPSVIELAGAFSEDIASRTEFAAHILIDAARLCLIPEGAPLYNSDMEKRLRGFAGRFTAAGISLMIDVVLKAGEDKKTCPGLNPRLLAESMIIKLLEVKSRCLR